MGYNYYDSGLSGCLILLTVGIIICFIVGFFEAWILMLLWNWLAPVFWAGAPVLGYWETFGIMVFLNLVGGILFKKAKTD